MNKRATSWYLVIAFVVVSSLLASCSSSGSSGSPSPAASSSSGASPSPSTQAATKEPYKIGVTGALTGPAAPSYLPNAEGVRIYFEALNAKGGIDGHPVQVLFEDDHADPGTATTNVQKFTGQGVNLLVNLTSSGSYPPTTAEAKRANLPIIMMGAAPDTVLPPKPDPLTFAIAQTASGSVAGPRLLFSAAQLMDGVPLKAAFVTVDIPTAVHDTNNAIAVAKQFNADVTMIKVPQGLADFTPIASQIISEGYNLATDIGPAIGVATYSALDKLGYKGMFYDFTSFDVADLAKLQKDNLYLSSPVGPIDTSRPDHKVIMDAAKTYGATITTSNLINGWSSAEAIAEMLRRTGWPINTEKLLKTMNSFEMAHGQTFPPTKWTETDHHGAFYWRFYHWDKSKQAIVTVMDWYRIDATGDTKSITKVGAQLP